MNRIIAYPAVLYFAFLMAGKAVAQQEYSAGFIEIDKIPETNVAMGLLYPSIAQETSRKWGPFRPELAWEGKPASGVFPIIVFSHGVTGRYINHRDTAATLRDLVI